MPLLNDATMQQQKLPTGHYGYSATRLDDLGAAEYTLVTIVNDVSPSVSPFRQEMEAALREIVSACKLSPRADNLMIRLVTFHGDMDEAHGFKLLEQCRLDDYRKILRIGSATALYDAAENAISAVTDYAQQLTDADFAVNSIVFVITDGEDNASTMGVGHVRAALTRAVTSEAMESLVSVLIGVNVKDPRIGGYLQDLKNEAGFTQYVEIGNANAKTLAKLADFVSRSISAQSQALGTGGSSQTLSFDPAMNSDCVYRIGRSHAVCQDYAVARGGEQPYVILADGCSSSPDTDIGARLLVKAAEGFIGCFPAPPMEVAPFPVTDSRQAGTMGLDAYHRQAILTARGHARLLGLSALALDATLLTAAVRGDRWFVAVCGDGVIAMKDREGRIHLRSIAFAEGMPGYLNYAADPARRAVFLARGDNHWTRESAVLEPDGSVREEVTMPMDRGAAGEVAPPAPQCWGECAARDRLPEVLRSAGTYTPPSIGGPEGPAVAYWETGDVADYEWVAVMSDGVHSFTEARATETVRTSAPVPLAAALHELLAFKSRNGVFVQRRVQRLLHPEGRHKACPWTHYDDLSMGVIALGG